MITLQVLKKGSASYQTAIPEQFESAWISFMQQVTVGADDTCTQFLYAGDVVIVSDTITSVGAALLGGRISLSGVVQNNVEQKGVAFGIANVAYVANVNGYAGVYYCPSPNSNGAFKGLKYAQSTATSYSGLVSALAVTFGFILVKQTTPDGKVRDIYLNPAAIQNQFGSISTQYTYMLKDGVTKIVENRTTSTYTSNFTGISSGDTIDTITTSQGTITLNLPCSTSPNRTAIAAAITNWLAGKGAVTGTVAVTSPSSGAMRIVIPTSNVIFLIATCTISTVSTPDTFVAS